VILAGFSNTPSGDESARSFIRHLQIVYDSLKSIFIFKTLNINK
jgi:hypothetical protein